MPDRSYHHGNLRETLLARAEQTVREHGVDGLSLRDLARQAGVSHGAPRRHFADRQALLNALAESGFARLGAQLRAAAAAGGHNYEARLHAVGTAYVQFATTNAPLLELMFASKQHEQTGFLREAADRAFSGIYDLIQEGQETGLLEDGDPERVGLGLYATMQGIAALVTSGVVAPEQVDNLVADAIARFLRGVPEMTTRPVE